MRYKRLLAILVSAVMVLNLFGVSGIDHVSAAVLNQEISSSDDKESLEELSNPFLLKEQKRFEKRKKEREEEEKQRKEMLSRWKKEHKIRKKAAGTRVVNTAMSDLLQEDGTSFQEAGAGSRITINNAQDLRNLSEYTAAGRNTEGVTFQQTGDIDCTAVTMAAIGRAIRGDVYVDEWGDETVSYTINYFMGTYEGGGHHVSNLNLYETDSNYLRHILGLFGYTYQAEISGLNIDSVQITECETEDDESAGKRFLDLGIFVGEGEETTINNCNNYADLSGKYRSLSGIAYSLGWDSKISDCINYGDLSSSNTGYVCGIAYSAYNAVSNCENKGDISKAAKGIGVLGEGEISDCVNRGNITDCMYSYGIIEYAERKLTNCGNEGNISAKEDAAGISGGNYINSSIYDRCYNSGTITTEDSIYGYAAGICTTGDNTTIINCVNTGKVNAAAYGGGIIGYGYKSVIDGCENTGTISGNSGAGGIAGRSYSGMTLCNLKNSGEITSKNYAGGIVAVGFRANLLNLWNQGDVTGKKAAGGILAESMLRDVFEWDYDGEGDEDEWKEFSTAYNKNYYASYYGNCINLGQILSEQASGALTGSSDLSDTVEFGYYQAGTAQKAFGNNNAVTAKIIEKDTWKSQNFAEELNQNIVSMKKGYPLLMDYEEEKGIVWRTTACLILDLEEGDSDYDMVEDYLSYAGFSFALYHKSTDSYLPMTENGVVYSAEVVPGEEYQLYRILENGAYQEEEISFKLEDGMTVAVQSRSYNIFRIYTEVSCEKDMETGEINRIKVGVPYYLLPYETMNDIKMPAEPVKEGYTFGGWYTVPYLYNEELTKVFIEEIRSGFLNCCETYGKWYDEMEEYLKDIYGSKTNYVKENMLDEFGYATIEELMANIDQYIDEQYKVEEPVVTSWDEDEEYTYLSSKILFARWIPIAVQTPTPTLTTPAPVINYQDADPSVYSEKSGNYVKKSGVIYCVNRQKKTAQVIGVTNRYLKKVVIQSSVKMDGVTYKVTSVGKTAFQDCKQLKTITVKGKNLKKVHKKALKGAYKKVKIKAVKKIKKLF